MKYPHLEDYAVRQQLYFSSAPLTHLPYGLQLALKEHDEKQICVARQNLHDLLSIYAVLTDIVHKNIDKVTPYPPRPMKGRTSNTAFTPQIRTPKGNNATSMY